MEKSKLQSFINRYYLAGNCEAVILKENETGVGCELIDMDQTVVGKIQWNTTPFMKGMLGINHTGALTKMLSALGEKIEIEVKDAAMLNGMLKIFLERIIPEHKKPKKIEVKDVAEGKASKTSKRQLLTEDPESRDI